MMISQQGGARRLPRWDKLNMIGRSHSGCPEARRVRVAEGEAQPRGVVIFSRILDTIFGD